MTGIKKNLTALLALLVSLCLLMPAVRAEDDDPLSRFVIQHGDRDSKKIAITVDDCYKNKRQHVVEDVELCRQYGVRMTFFPVVYTGCMEPKYREIWQAVVDAGCEIGTHSTRHLKLGNRNYWDIVATLGLAQQALDETLGYHYQIQNFRPPYGSIEDGKETTQKKIISAIRRYGFDHIIHWDVSNTDPETVMKKVQNGSILLFHAKKGDTDCLRVIIPQLLEQGYELVTVSELLGMDPPEISDELYVYNKEDYRDP